jgi:Arc/MetJ-type ribon-helix-helix transcriptional regulator
MNSQLSPENEQFLEHAISVGIFHDRDEALDRAVAVLRRREQLICDVNKGIDQIESGEGIPLDIEKIQGEVESRFQEVLKKRQQNGPT